MYKLIICLAIVLTPATVTATDLSESKVSSLAKCIGYSTSFDKKTLDEKRSSLAMIFKSYFESVHALMKTEGWVSSQKDNLFHELNGKDQSPDFYAGYILSGIVQAEQTSIRKYAETRFKESNGVGDLGTLWNEEAVKRFNESNCALIKQPSLAR
ncbi:hypothetical protein [Serratia marcescens]|uniref:hypothetical protein n=1 Tax=Serratia marcescens TaxID=615 RepID=UPI00275203DE|nr:hypothetical protein [Serratia marcescens]MDP8744647.1 hypothetical protein [Serratia marcescens]